MTLRVVRPKWNPCWWISL